MCVNEALQLHPDGHVHVFPQVDASIENLHIHVQCICMELNINFISYRDYVGQ